MVGVMLALSHHTQVLDGVVAGVLVLMVDEFDRQQESPDVPLHDQSVLHDVAFRVCVGMLGRQERDVSVAASVPDSPNVAGVIRASDVLGAPRRRARWIAKLLTPVARGPYFQATRSTRIRRRGSPSALEIAGAGTVVRSLGSPVFRVKRYRTSCTGKGDTLASHTRSITQLSEAYCKTAVERLTIGIKAARQIDGGQARLL